MAVVEDVLLEAPPASPELALVDPELAAELRRAHSPVDDRWLRPPAGVEESEAESEDPIQLAVDSGYAESHDTQRALDDEFIVATPPEQTPAEELRPSSNSSILRAPEPEEAAFEASIGIESHQTQQIVAQGLAQPFGQAIIFCAQSFRRLGELSGRRRARVGESA